MARRVRNRWDRRARTLRRNTREDHTIVIEKILSTEEAAQFMGVSVETMSNLLESQEVPGRLLDGKWRTTGRALLNYVDGGSDMNGCCCCPPDADGKGCCSGRPGCC